MSDERPFTPEARARSPEITGTPVATADGVTWVYADWLPELEDLWSRLYDQNVLAGRYEPADVRRAAFRLLAANYDLTLDETRDVVFGTDLGGLVDATEAALFGPDRSYRGYAEWVGSSLWANGIDPDAVPPHLLHSVLDQLVMTGRAVPQSKFVSSAAHASVAGILRGFIRPPAPAPTPEPAPANGDAT